MGAEGTWRVLCRFCINVFAGASDYISTDTGTNFNAPVLKDQAAQHITVVQIASKEAHDGISVRDRIHAYLSTVYSKLCVEIPSICKRDRLSLTFRVLNDTRNSNTGICSTTLVYGTFLKIPDGVAYTNTKRRSEIITKGT